MPKEHVSCSGSITGNFKKASHEILVPVLGHSVRCVCFVFHVGSRLNGWKRFLLLRLSYDGSQLSGVDNAVDKVPGGSEVVQFRLLMAQFFGAGRFALIASGRLGHIGPITALFGTDSLG